MLRVARPTPGVTTALRSPLQVETEGGQKPRGVGEVKDREGVMEVLLRYSFQGFPAHPKPPSTSAGDDFGGGGRKAVGIRKPDLRANLVGEVSLRTLRLLLLAPLSTKALAPRARGMQMEHMDI